MSCYQCMEPFSFFNRQQGCANCGFGFCSQCLTKKTPVPKLGNNVNKVCDKCYKQLTSVDKSTKNENPWDLPENFKKRLAMPPAYTGPSGSRGSGGGGGGGQCRSADADSALRSRLDKLQTPSKDPASVEELQSRLEKLRTPASTGPSAQNQRAPSHTGLDPVFTRPPPSEQEQIDNLLRENMARVQLDQNFSGEPVDDEAAGNEDDPDTLIRRAHLVLKNERDAADAGALHDERLRAKLNALRGGSTAMTVRDWLPTRPLTDEEQADQIAALCVLESRLEGEHGNVQLQKSSEKTPEEGDEDYPWCCICTSRASWKCPQCEDDLYCNACNKQSHAMPGYHGHKPLPLPKKGKK